MAKRNLTLYKELMKELQHIYSKGKLKDSPTYGYMKEMFKKYEVTGEKYCRGQEEIQHMGETYLCLLQSVRKYKELSKLYRGKGERSVESTAELVGFKLPQPVADSLDKNNKGQ
ncbi:hypothetical protein ScPMuIL_012019 [Solemya velum]